MEEKRQKWITPRGDLCSETEVIKAPNHLEVRTSEKKTSEQLLTGGRRK